MDENGVRTGMGHLEVPNGSTFDGSFDKVDFYLFFLKRLCKDLNLIKGLPNGIGVMRFPDSSRYEGQSVDSFIDYKVYFRRS